MKIKSIVFITSSIVCCVTYSQDIVIRQPAPVDFVVNAASYLTLLKTKHLDDIDAVERIALSNLLNDIARRKDVMEQLALLRTISSVHTGNQYVDNVLDTMSDIATTIGIKTVRVFDVLVPTINVLHNYLTALVTLSSNETQKVLQRLYNVYMSVLKGVADRYFREGLWYLRNNVYEAEYGPGNTGLFMMSLAQALLVRLKDIDEEARVLFEKIDTYQPVSFNKELELLGYRVAGKAGER